MTEKHEEIMKLLKARSDALVKGDTDFFSRILSDDFRYVNSSGKVFDKSAYMEFCIKSGQMRWKSQELDQVSISFHGDIAVITCRVHDQAFHTGKEFDGFFYSTQIFMETADGWKYTLGQSTYIES